jgi:hypothetical protein
MRLRVMELPAAEWSAPLLSRGLLANCGKNGGIERKAA